MLSFLPVVCEFHMCSLLLWIQFRPAPSNLSRRKADSSSRKLGSYNLNNAGGLGVGCSEINESQREVTELWLSAFRDTPSLFEHLWLPYSKTAYNLA